MENNRNYIFLDTARFFAFGQIGRVGHFQSFRWNTYKNLCCMLTSIFEEMLDSAKIRLSDLDFFAICSGPGSLTGLRVGFAFLRTLAQVTQKPLVGIDLFSWAARTLEKRGLRGKTCLYIPAFQERVFALPIEIPFPGHPHRNSAPSMEPFEYGVSLAHPPPRGNHPSPLPQLVVKPSKISFSKGFGIKYDGKEEEDLEPDNQVLHEMLMKCFIEPFELAKLLEVKPFYIVPSQAEMKLLQNTKC